MVSFTQSSSIGGGRSCLVTIISLFLSFLLIQALALAIPITFLRLTLTDHNIEVIVDKLIDSIDLTSIEIPTENGTQNFAGAILEFTSEVDGLNLITEEQINEFLLNDFIKQTVTDILKQYGLSLTQGEEYFKLNAEQIYDYVEANKDTLVKLAREAGYEGDIPFEEHKDTIVASIENAIGSEGISVETLIGESEEAIILGDYLKTAQLVFSNSVLWLIWGLVAVLMILLFVLNLGALDSFMRACGFPALIVGGLYSIIAYSVDSMLTMFEIENDTVADLLAFVGGFAASLLKGIALPIAIIGIVLVLSSFIFSLFKQRN